VLQTRHTVQLFDDVPHSCSGRDCIPNRCRRILYRLQRQGAIMRKKPKSRATTKLDMGVIEKHTAALEKHTKELREHSKAMTAATAALIATKPQKPLGQRTTDAQLCMSQWLVDVKHVSQADSMDPNKNMATDFRVGGPPGMSRCLNSVSQCLSGKGDIYTPDAASAAQLCTKSLGEVVNFIASKIR
jgi:hypothetical protein